MKIITDLITEISVLFGVLIPFIIWLIRITNGQKCQLRSEMLRIYFRNKDSQSIRQYEFENFGLLYKAYKSLGGNSFVDKINREMEDWSIRE